MQYRSSRTGFVCPRGFARLRALGLALAIVAASALAASAQSPVFAPTGATLQGPPASPASVAEVPISVDFAALAANPASITLSRTDGSTFKANRTGFESRGKGDFAWRGVPAADGGASEGDITLTVKHGLLAGLITLKDEVYEIQPRGGAHRLMRLDQSLFPPCATNDGDGVVADPIPGRPLADVSRGNLTSASVSQIDILTVYTPQAQAAAGGAASMDTTIQSAVDVANTSFTASGIDVHFNLVHTALVNHNDSNNTGTDLAWVAGDATVKAMRNQYYADLVSLVVENGGSGVCGQAYVQRSISSGFSESAFQVTVRSCAVGNLSYAHEHGHNLGFEHNPENGIQPPTSASFVWSYGHYVDGSFRTVMSYADPCTLGCTRVQRFSNPGVSFNGFPTGITDQRDNHRTGNISAPIVAGFRVPGLDTDGDGIEDIADNCPTVPNSDQHDSDGDGKGDACDLNVDQKQKVMAVDGASSDQFGIAVSIDGTRAAIGSEADDDQGTDSGSAYVYSYSGTTWVQEAKLLPSTGQASSLWGRTIGISGDTVVVGDYGAARANVFRRTGSTWAQEAVLTATPAVSMFGTSVAVEGNTVVVGEGSATVQKVYVFERSGTVWTQTQAISTGLPSINGAIVKLRGNLILVGFWETGTGRVQVYRKNGAGTWGLDATLLPSDGGNFDSFGAGMDTDGTTIVIGSPFHDQPASTAGAAYVFGWNGTTWTQSAKIQSPDIAAGDSFGDSVQMLGGFVAIGAEGDNSSTGAVYLYKKNGSTWSYYAKVTPGDVTTLKQFGSDVSLSGSWMLIGAATDDQKAFNAGAAYFFTMPPLDTDNDGVPDSVDNCPTVANSNQSDVDNDGIGDACDTCTDIDHDGYGNPASATCTHPEADCHDDDPAVNPGHAEVPGNGTDDDCNAATPDCVDADADGYSVSGGVCGPVDCNDSNASVNPGHAEVPGNGVDDDCNAATPDCVDADGDGYSVSGGVCGAIDCNDANASVHPGAAESCNGVDDNCNGTIDEGVTITFYRDADGDTFGNLAVTTQACSAPAGYVANSTDCNDSASSVHPGAAEVCNGIDDNCNGQTDEGVSTTFYRDADGDNYGNPAVTTQACAQPAGYVINNTDCNDANASVNPGKTEIPGNGLDDDCNPATKDCKDLDADGYGNPASADCAHPQLDCNDANANINPGMTEIPGNGLDDDCNPATPGGCSAP